MIHRLLALPVNDSYLVFTSGVEEDVFVKEIDRGQRKVGEASSLRSLFVLPQVSPGRRFSKRRPHLG